MKGYVTQSAVKRICLSLLLVMVAFSVLAGCGGEAAPVYQNISADELIAILQEEKDYFLVDVREPEELLETGFIPGAVNIPVSKLKQDFSTLPQTGKLIIYCRTGRRSADAAGFLTGKGFNNVYNLKGGIVAWPYEKVQPAG
ncbi:MAG TPA: hypothetical protein DEF34_06635 [Desulfotomaculum sp.]|nr:hypothetical protein [Desulfotomaculum sp.]